MSVILTSAVHAADVQDIAHVKDGVEITEGSRHV